MRPGPEGSSRGRCSTTGSEGRQRCRPGRTGDVATDYAAFVPYAVDPAGDAAEVPAEPALAAYVHPER